MMYGSNSSCVWPTCANEASVPVDSDVGGETVRSKIWNFELMKLTNRVVPTAPCESGGVSVGSFGPSKLSPIFGACGDAALATVAGPVPAGWVRAHAAFASDFCCRYPGVMT